MSHQWENFAPKRFSRIKYFKCTECGMVVWKRERFKGYLVSHQYTKEFRRLPSAAEDTSCEEFIIRRVME